MTNTLDDLADYWAEIQESLTAALVEPKRVVDVNEQIRRNHCIQQSVVDVADTGCDGSGGWPMLAQF